MPSRRSGHIVQIWRPVKPSVATHFVEVEGWTISTTVSQSFYDVVTDQGWASAGREQPLRDAKFYAKAYARAGIKSRVILQMNSGRRCVVVQYRPKRQAVRHG